MKNMWETLGGRESDEWMNEHGVATSTINL